MGFPLTIASLLSAGALQGERAKAVARAVAAAGGRAYVLKGGFAAWEAAGLKVRQPIPAMSSCWHAECEEETLR